MLFLLLTESASAVKKESMQENKNIQDLEGLIENLADTLQSSTVVTGQLLNYLLESSFVMILRWGVVVNIF